MTSQKGSSPGSARWRAFEKVLYRYAGIVSAAIVALEFDFQYFYPDLPKLPPGLREAVLAIGAVVLLSFLFFVVPVLSVWQLLSGGWYLWRGEARWPAVLWRSALAIVSLLIWIATIGRFEFPGN
jgi:hypothetical protein